MFHAASETIASNHVAPRQQQARDGRPPSSGFSELLATSAPENDSPRQPASRKTDSKPRLASSQQTRQANDQAAPDTSRPPSAPASNAPPADDPVAPAQVSLEKPEKSADATVSLESTDKPAATGVGLDAAALVAAAVIPAAGVNGPVAVVSPVPGTPVPTVPQPVTQPPSTAPLAIAGAAIPTAKPQFLKIPTATAQADDSDKPTAGILIADAASPPAPEGDAVQTLVPSGLVKTVMADVQTVATPVLELGDGKLALSDQAPVSGVVVGKAEARLADRVAAPAAKEDDVFDTNATPTSALQPKSHDSRAAVTADITVAPDTMQAQPLPAVQAGTSLTSPPLPLPPSAAAPTAPVPLAGLAVELAAKAHDGASRFEIRLDPADLGRIDVRIDVDKQGQVTSHLTVEKPETLSMLRQDAPQLQRALNDAGLKTGDSALQFTLGEQSQRHADNSDRRAQHFIIRDDETLTTTAPIRSYGRPLALRGGVDISV